MSRSRARSFRSWLAPLIPLALVGLPACTGTETDNPTADTTPAPPYESPIEFVPGRGAPPACVPPPDHGKPRGMPLWGRDGTRLVGADRGLRVIDASDPRAPQLAGQLALPGEPHGVLVEPGPFVTLALDELPEVEGDDVPAPRTLEAVTRLVRYDARDPLQITRVAEVDLEGELWSLSQRGELTWVMSARGGELPSCDVQPLSCRYPAYDALILTAYRARGAAYEQLQRVELPMNQHAWVTGEGFAAVEASADGGGLLRAVRFGADGLLAAVSELQLPRPVADGAPLSLANDQARVLLRDLSDGSAELAIFDLTSGVRVGSLSHLLQTGPIRFGARAVYFGDETGQRTMMVDTTDPSSLRTLMLPSAVAQLWPLDPEGTRLLGMGEDPTTRDPIFTLLQAGAGGLDVLDQLPITEAMGPLSNDAIWLHGDHLLFAYAQPAAGARLDALAIGDSSLTWFNVAHGGYADEVVVGEGVVYASDPFGLTVGSLGFPPAQSARLTWGEQIEAYVVAGEREAALVQRLGAPLELRITLGAETIARAASPGASRLIADDDRLLVLSSEPVEQSGADCSGYTPNVEIYRFEGEPELLASVALPDAELNADAVDSQVRLEWTEVEGSPFALADGRHVFAARLYASCTREAACARLGIEARPIAEANVAPSGAVACPPNAATCPPAPEPATVYGKKDALRFYVLDVRADEPRFSAVAESVLELGDSRFGTPRVSGGELLVPRLERATQRPTPGQPSAQGPASARFMLDRFELAGDGSLRAQPAINLPGYALALRAGGEILVSAEPDRQQPGGAKLHRLALRADGAHVLQSLALDGVYGQLEVIGDRAIYLQRIGEGCDGTTRLVPVRLPDDAGGELRAQPALELPGDDWTLIDARAGRLLLQSHFLRYAVIELGESAPTLLEFIAGSHYMEEPRLSDDAIVGASSFWGEQRLEL